MTPKVPNQNQNPSFLDWDPSKTGPAPKETDDCNGRCHPSPKNVPGSPSFQNSNKWFLESLKTDEPPLPSNFPLRNLPPVAPAPPPKVEPKPTVKPGAPADAATLNDQAKELERQGRLATDPEQKTHFYQSALSFRLLSGDDSGATALLNELDGIYKKSNDPVGQKLVAATRLWVDGKPDDALKALADMEKEATGAAFYRQYSHHRSLLLQLAAGGRIKDGDYEGGKDLLMKALLLNPTDQLTSQILKLMAKHGDADLLQQRKNILSLEDQRERLVAQGTPCNTSCHTSTNDKLNQFDFPVLTGPGMIPTPDLSPYRNLKLSYDQKMMLFNIDSQLDEARKHLRKSTDAVETLLFVQRLDDPKADIGEFEARFLKDAKNFDGPDRSLPWHLAGEAYLAKKDWAKAAVALQNAVKDDPSLVDAQFSLGHAQFALGDFKASRDAYTEILKRQPQDVMALRYRAEANSQYLTSLDPKHHADEITTVNSEIASDRALLMARMSHNEKSKLTELKKQLDLLREGGDASLESRQGAVDMIELLAKQYLALAETKQPNVGSAELVRKEMGALASQAFDLLAEFAKADSDPEIKKRAGLYEGYSLLAQGKIDEAVKKFEPHRATVPEIDKILGTLEKSKLRMVNLAALDAWTVYNKEGSRIQADNQNGIIGGGIGLIEGAFRSDGKDFRDDTQARWKSEEAFVAELRSKIESGKADTILDAMKLIEANGPESMKAGARYYINYEDKVITGYPLGALVHLVSKHPPEKGAAQELLRKTWDLERQNSGAVECPYAFYTLVNALDTEANFNGTARQHMDALEGHGSFGRSAFKFITSMSPESLAVDVMLMVASAGLGNLAKLAALSKLEKAGVTGYKAVVLAGAAGVGVEATALWAGNLGKEAMIKDPSKVFTADHMLKSYGATLIMIGGLKGFGALGETVAPRAAKSLGMVTEGGTKLTAGGKVLSWGIGHGMGLSGMIGTSHINQAIGLTPKPIGGWKEGLVHDVFGYVQFAVAHKIADRAFAGKLSSLSSKQHTEIAVKEAIVLAKSQADAMGFKATRGPKGELVDSPERQIVVGILVDSALNRPGFSGGKLAKLVEQKKLAEANAYFAEFKLPLEYNKAGDLVAVARGEASPHEAAGIPAGKAKPPPKPIDLNLFVKSFSEKFGEILDKAAELLFGPPGGGGFGGGLQPILNGGYGTYAPKAEPKGPPAVFMAGKGRGEKSSKTTKTKTPVVDPNPPAEKAANDNQYHEVIGLNLKAGENIDAALVSLAKHFDSPAKIIVINCERPVDNPALLKSTIEAYDAAARIEIHQPGGRPPIEVPGKSRMDQIHPDTLNDGKVLMWDAGPKGVRELFEVPGKNGEIFLAKPDGVNKLEIQTLTPLSKEDIAYLSVRSRHLKVEIEVSVSDKHKMTFKATEEGLKISSDKPITAEELNTLVEMSVKAGEKVEVTTPDGKLEIQNGSSAKDSKLSTKDVKTALLAPDLIVLNLDKVPTRAELEAMNTQGVKRILLKDDPTSPNWLANTLPLLQAAKGINFRVNDPKGKVLWENSRKDGVDTLNVATDGFKLGVETQAKSGKPIALDKISSEQLGLLAEQAVKSGVDLSVKTDAGTIEVQGKGQTEARILTKDPKAAAQAPDRIALQLDKPPTEAELATFKTDGVKRLVFQDDPAATGFLAKSFGLMQASRGIAVQALDSKGQPIWESVPQSSGADQVKTAPGVFKNAVAEQAKASGWKNRLEETQKLLGPEGARYDFAAETLRWAASHDISEASSGKVKPEQVDAWLKHGTELTATKHTKAVEKGNTKLQGELAPFAEGLSVDPANKTGWNLAVSRLKDYLGKYSSNKEVTGKLFQMLERDPANSLAFENNAYELAKHLVATEEPHKAIKELVDFGSKSSGLLKIQGSYFGSFLNKGDTGSKAEVNTLNDMVTEAGLLTAQGHQVVIEAIPTSKMLEGKTPDFSITVTSGALKSSYVVEVKRAASETIKKSGANNAEFTSELQAGYAGRSSNDSTLGSLIGKGLYQLGSYKGKNPGDYLILNVRLDGNAPVYLDKALKDFLTANCPGIVIKVIGQDGSETILRADGVASKYSPYDASSKYFAPSLPPAATK